MQSAQDLINEAKMRSLKFGGPQVDAIDQITSFTFGKGAIEGIAGPEAANNAATGGAMVPTLPLGIPGSATSTVILGALMVHGLGLGPHLFAQQPHMLYAIFIAILVANVLFMDLGLVGAKAFARVRLIPRTFLWPSVFVLAVVGSYALSQSVLDVWIMLIFGILGFVLRRYDFSIVFFCTNRVGAVWSNDRAHRFHDPSEKFRTGVALELIGALRGNQRRPQRPVNTGLRFSMNARRPSM